MVNNLEKENNSYLDMILYAVGFLAILFTPLLARLVAPLFDWVGYGSCTPFFKELFTAVFWVIEIIIISGIYSRKYNKKILVNEDNVKGDLSINRILVISAVVIACILIISVQIDFRVKPFYDLGEKFNGYELLNNVGIFVRNIIKCIWIVVMLAAAQNVVEDIVGRGMIKIPAAGIIAMATIGLYDILTGMNNLPVTYFFLYIVYGWIYLLTDRNLIKTYLLVMFIFLF